MYKRQVFGGWPRGLGWRKNKTTTRSCRTGWRAWKARFAADYHKPSDDFDKITPEVFIASTDLVIETFEALDKGLDR